MISICGLVVVIVAGLVLILRAASLVTYIYSVLFLKLGYLTSFLTYLVV